MRRDFVRLANIIIRPMVDIIDRDTRGGEDRDAFLERVVDYVEATREALKIMERHAKAEQEDRLKGMV